MNLLRDISPFLRKLSQLGDKSKKYIRVSKGMPVIPKQLTSEISRKEHIILCTLIGIVYLCNYETINRNMDTVIHNDQMVIRPIDTL